MLVNQSCGGHTAIALRLPVVDVNPFKCSWLCNLFVFDDHNAIDTNEVQWQLVLFVQHDPRKPPPTIQAPMLAMSDWGAGH